MKFNSMTIFFCENKGIHKSYGIVYSFKCSKENWSTEECPKFKVRKKFRRDWSQYLNKRKSQNGQDQVSGGVSVLCWLAAPLQTFYGNLPKLGNTVIDKVGNRVQLGNRITS